MAVDNAGNLYIQDSYRIRKVSGGIITTVSGGDGIVAKNSMLDPSSISLDSAGNLLIAEDNREQKLDAETGILILSPALPDQF